MHKVLWDAIEECLKERDNGENTGYCVDCPLGSECSELEELNE